MSQQLILLRHAKSVSQFSALDFDRTLNEKGKQDAPMVAKAFAKLEIVPDIILCSTAARTQATLELFKNELNLNAPIVYLDELYHAAASEIYDIVQKYLQHKKILVVGHNFGISNLANQLSIAGAQEMNTCGLYVFNFTERIEWNKGQIFKYLSPKTI